MRILHLIDETTEWWNFDALDELITHATRSGGPIAVEVAGMGAAVPPRFAGRWPRARRLGFASRIPMAGATWLRAVRRAFGCDLIHAWGVVPAATARLAGVPEGRLLLGLSHPLTERGEDKWLRTVRRDAAIPVVCPTGAVRRSLIERGHPPDLARVIRPAVDFARLNATNRLEARRRLGLDANQPVLITCPPPSRAGGQYFAIWAVALLEQIFPDIRLIVPGESPEWCRLQRFARGFGKPHLVLFLKPHEGFVDLIAAADVCLAPAIDAVSTVPLTWAMAAKLPIVGSVIPEVTELLAHGHNALLCRPGRPDLLAARIRQVLRDRHLAWRLADTARGQAFEVFRRSHMLEQYRRVYDNLMSGLPPFENVSDAALRA